MRLSEALTAVGAVLRRRPADLLPFYVLGVAVPAIARLVSFVGIAIAVLYLETTGRFDVFFAEIGGYDLDPPNPETEPEAFGTWAESVAPLFEPLVTPVSVGLLVSSVLATALVLLVLSAAVAAGQLAACNSRLMDRRGLTAGIAGVRSHSVSFLGLYVLEGLLWLVVTAVAIGAVLVVALVSFWAAIVVALVASLFWFLSVVGIRAVFAFAPVAIVVDDVGVGGSLRGSVEFIRVRLIDAVAYYLVAIGTLVGFGVLATAFSVLGIGTLAVLVGLFLVTPALDLLRTALYAGHRGSLSPPSTSTDAIHGQLVQGVRRGWYELRLFVRESPGFHALAIASLGAGFWMGWIAAGSLVGHVETSIDARLAGIVPPTAAIEIFANNWTVALSMAYAGVALIVPTLAALWFNGFVFGLVGRLEVAPLELLAFVVPHGIIEIPALLVSGSLGVYLGVVGWRTWRGSADRAELADTMERAFWILVGLGLVLAVAGFIEGFISPFYYRLLL